jgi:hypothetical protein
MSIVKNYVEIIKKTDIRLLKPNVLVEKSNSTTFYHYFKFTQKVNIPSIICEKCLGIIEFNLSTFFFYFCFIFFF